MFQFLVAVFFGMFQTLAVVLGIAVTASGVGLFRCNTPLTWLVILPQIVLFEVYYSKLSLFGTVTWLILWLVQIRTLEAWNAGVELAIVKEWVASIARYSHTA